MTHHQTLPRLATRGAALALASALAACAGPETTDTSRTLAPGKPTDEVGGETLVFPARAALPEARGRAPEPGSLELRVYNASPVGVIEEAAVDAYRIYVEAENVSDAAVSLQPAWVRAVVTHEGAALAGCAGEPIPVREAGAVGTSGALFVSVPLPCALGEGEYEVAVTFSVGAPPGDERASLERTLRSELAVDASLPPYDAGWIPPRP